MSLWIDLYTNIFCAGYPLLTHGGNLCHKQELAPFLGIFLTYLYSVGFSMDFLHTFQFILSKAIAFWGYYMGFMRIHLCLGAGLCKILSDRWMLPIFKIPMTAHNGQYVRILAFKFVYTFKLLYLLFMFI